LKHYTFLFGILCTDKDEVVIADNYPKPVIGRNFSIYARYSVGPHDSLTWYHNGSPLKSSPFVSIASDGLNMVLQLSSSFHDMYGSFSLRIDGTNTKDQIIILPGIFDPIFLLCGNP